MYKTLSLKLLNQALDLLGTPEVQLQANTKGLQLSNAH
jgi:hypothetical protein